MVAHRWMMHDVLVLMYQLLPHVTFVGNPCCCSSCCSSRAIEWA